MNTQKLYFTKHASICMLTNNLIKITFISDGEIDLSEAKEMHSIALKLSKDMPYAVLIISSKHHNLVTKSARSYLATIESRLAEAIVVDNLPNRIMARFYFKLVQANPTKIFKTEEEAKTWLLKYIKT